MDERFEDCITDETGKTRQLYPNQYVKLNILDSHIEGKKKIVTDVALIQVIDNAKTATKELLRASGNTIVYHTGTEAIVIEIRNRKTFPELKKRT